MFQSKEGKQTKKKRTPAGLERRRGWAVLKRSRLGRLSDAMGISRDLGLGDEFAAAEDGSLGILLWSGLDAHLSHVLFPWPKR